MSAPNCSFIFITHTVCHIFPGKLYHWKYITINQLKYHLCSCTMGMWVWCQGYYSTQLRLVLYWPLNHALAQYFL